MFRNFGRILGPFSELGLIHKWGPGEQFSATFVWIDPTNTVAGSYEVKIDVGNQVGSSLYIACFSFLTIYLYLFFKLNKCLNSDTVR